MINFINMKINNGRMMQLAQQKVDGEITLTTYDIKSGLVDNETTISPADMVTLINYYRYQTDNGLPIF